MIRLDTVDTIAPEHLAQLAAYDDWFRSQDSLEGLLEIAAIARVVSYYNEDARERGFVGYHFTRAFIEEIREHGLVSCRGEECLRRATIGPDRHFSESQLDRIAKLWTSSYREEQRRIRDLRVWFTTTKRLDLVPRASNFYRWFGGELLNRALHEHPDLMAALEGMGTPLVVTCRVDAQQVKGYWSDSLGACLVSAYHLSLNAEAEWHAIEVYQSESLPPDRILEIEEIVDDGASRKV